MKEILLFALSFVSLNLYSQNVGIGTNAPKDYNKLEVNSTESGFQLPRMTTAQRATLKTNIEALSAALSAQYSGMLVYDLSNNTLYMWDASKSTNGDWANVMDEDASIDDADADPTNEHNTDLTLTGTTLNVIDGGGTESQDLSSLQDHDWYESTGTDQADVIGDDIYTNGNVGVGDTDPSVNLNVVGVIRASDAADETEYIEMDHEGSNAYINWVGDGNLDVRRAGTNIAIFEQDGDLAMQGDNSIKMPNNIVYVEDWGSSVNYLPNTYRNVTGYTSYMTVESGDVLKAQFSLSTRLSIFIGGYSSDNILFRILIDGTGACADTYSEELHYQPDEDIPNRDNFQPVSYMDIIPVTCDGTMRFRLQMINYGGYTYDVENRSMAITKF